MKILLQAVLKWSAAVCQSALPVFEFSAERSGQPEEYLQLSAAAAAERFVLQVAAGKAADTAAEQSAAAADYSEADSSDYSVTKEPYASALRYQADAAAL